MGLELLKEYVLERYGHQVVEVPNGFAVYGKQQYHDDEIVFVQDFYVKKDNRGFTTKSSSRQLFNKLKDIAKQWNCGAICGTVQLDTLNGNDMLKLFLHLGFKVIRGDGTGILILYEVKK